MIVEIERYSTKIPLNDSIQSGAKRWIEYQPNVTDTKMVIAKRNG